jgi:hypothetical protein
MCSVDVLADLGVLKFLAKVVNIGMSETSPARVPININPIKLGCIRSSLTQNYRNQSLYLY